MSENINDMDKILNEKISNMKFEFKDAYWTEMEALLNQQKNKIGFFWWIFGSTSIAVLTLFLFWMNYVPAAKSMNQYASETIVSQQLKNGEILNKNTEIKTVVLNNQKNERFNKTEQIKTNSSASTIKARNQVVAKSNQNYVTSTKVDKLSHNQSSSVSTNTNQQLEKIDFSQNALNKNSTPNSPNLISANEHQIQPNELDKITVNKVTVNDASDKLNEVVVKPSEDDLKHDKEKLDIMHEQGLLAGPVIQLPLLPLYKLNTDVMTPSTPITLVQRKPVITHTFLAEAGVGYGANSFSKPKFGGEKIHLGFVYQLEKSNWGLKTGINASWTSVNGLNYFSRQRIYGFSSSVVTNQLNYRSLINMVIPLEATYHIKKHIIGLGVKLNVLLTTSAKSKNWSDAQVNSKLDWNYRESLAPVSLAAVFDYSYNIAKRWNIGAAFSYSITPVISNERNLFNQPATRMFSGQLFIQYKLSNFKK